MAGGAEERVAGQVGIGNPLRQGQEEVRVHTDLRDEPRVRPCAGQEEAVRGVPVRVRVRVKG